MFKNVQYYNDIVFILTKLDVLQEMLVIYIRGNVNPPEFYPPNFYFQNVVFEENLSRFRDFLTLIKTINEFSAKLFKNFLF